MPTLEQTLAERGSRYGDFTSHARIAQALQGVMRSAANPFGSDVTSDEWNRLSDVQKQALTVIADKIARILNGDPEYVDNWHDIAGYAKLVEDRLQKPQINTTSASFGIEPLEWHPITDTTGYVTKSDRTRAQPTTAVHTTRMTDEIIDAYCCCFPDGRTFWCDTLGDAMKAVEAWEKTPHAAALPHGCMGGFVELRMPRSKYVALGTSNADPIVRGMLALDTSTPAA